MTLIIMCEYIIENNAISRYDTLECIHIRTSGFWSVYYLRIFSSIKTNVSVFHGPFLYLNLQMFGKRCRWYGGVGEMLKSRRDRVIITSSRPFYGAFKTSPRREWKSVRINFHYDGFLWTATNVALITALAIPLQPPSVKY